MPAGPELLSLLRGSETHRLHRGQYADSGARVLVKSLSQAPKSAADFAVLRRECDHMASLSCAKLLQP